MGLISVKLTEDHSNVVFISQKLSDQLGTTFIKSSVLRFGLKVAEIEIIIDKHISEDELLIAKNVADKLNIPTSCNYELMMNESKEFVIGPFIGIYMGRKQATLHKKLRLVNSFASKYTSVNGTIFAFTLDNVQKSNLTIKGYFYNPNMDCWEEATLPYPSSIFLRNTMNIEWREHFKAIYGNNIFNFKPFDKWEMYEKLKQFPEMINVMPQTVLYKSPNNILDMLETHQNLYVKPIGGKKGLGIYNIAIKDNDIEVQTRENQENLKWTYNKEEFYAFIQEKLLQDKFVIQETIDLKIDNKVMDFRVGMEKDKSGEWKNMMLVTRLSGDSSIVSNRAAGGGSIIRVTEALKEIYKMDEEKVIEYEKKLISIAKNASIYLEKTGLNLGKLAFDLAIDKNHKVWIIEINSRYPDDSLATKIGDSNIYYDIRNTNMLYAKKLAGFSKTSGNVLKFEDNIKVNEGSRRYKVMASIPRDQRKMYIEHVANVANELGLTGKLDFNNLVKKVDIEIEGGESKIKEFLIEANVGEEIQTKSILSIEEINPVRNEQGFNKL
ncbi:YheC/YheD family endospore coat-associated protein [Oceanobacillus manasiensis]|uniref:YheC/YheD family endospore coat-associated protein n=1 Tax=Oceanobacillus manasiensis TaxID=586413 RepID=UPI0005AB2292|nr:YheC/YheD family protein [Oceanobacillus manasiensis]